MVAFNTAPHPDSQYDNIYGTLQERREEQGKAQEFPNIVKHFSYNAWGQHSITFLDIADKKQLDHNQPPEFATIQKHETDEQNTFHHIFPKSFAHFISINPKGNALAAEFFPVPFIRNLIIKNYNHPLNCLPVMDTSHALLHNPLFNSENYNSWVSLYDNHRDNALISDKMKFLEISNFLGIPNWFYQYDNYFFAMNVITMKHALKYHKKLSRIDQQYIYDIHNAFDLLIHQKPDLSARTTRFLLQEGIIEHEMMEM